MQSWIDGQPGQMGFLIGGLRLRPVADKTISHKGQTHRAAKQERKEITFTEVPTRRKGRRIKLGKQRQIIG